MSMCQKQARSSSWARRQETLAVWSQEKTETEVFWAEGQLEWQARDCEKKEILPIVWFYRAERNRIASKKYMILLSIYLPARNKAPVIGKLMWPREATLISSLLIHPDISGTHNSTIGSINFVFCSYSSFLKTYVAGQSANGVERILLRQNRSKGNFCSSLMLPCSTISTQVTLMMRPRIWTHGLLG